LLGPPLANPVRWVVRWGAFTTRISYPCSRTVDCAALEAGMLLLVKGGVLAGDRFAVVVSMVAPAVAGNGSDEVTLRLAEKAADDEQFSTDVDVGKQGFSVGDYTVLRGEPIYNRALTKKVGVLRGDVLVVSHDETSVAIEVDVTFDLDGGLITVEGPISFSGSEANFDPVQELAVTGGTDAYKTAHGELKVDFSDEEGARFTFKVVR
jgi:hypothetical protein